MTTLEAYERIAPVYDSAPNPLLALEERILTPLLPDFHGQIIADIGAGTGRWLHRGGRTLAFDLSPAMLRSAPSPQILADATAIPLRDATADIVLCTFTLGYAPTCFPELVRILKPTGTLVITDLHPGALTRGWTRTFRIGDEIIEPPNHHYALDTLTHPSLVQTHFEQPHLGEPERILFQQAGKPAAFDAASAHPAIFIAFWTKQ